MRTKDYPLAKLEFDEQKNILFYRVKQDQVVDVAEIKEMLVYVQEFMGPVRHYAVIDFGGNLSSSTEARQVYADAEYLQKWRIADAFLVKSLPVRLIANFFIKVTKPKVNTRLFVDESAAINWLESLKE
ncbi:MAG: hypothetical protein IPJ32_01370 [Sphingobacteriaceae bacterium]|nr:hypothetical protein [Sphingobacteriaceae bacterium]